MVLLAPSKLRRHRLQLVRDLDRLAVVPIAVAGEEELWLDLAEAVEHAALAEIGRAGGEGRAERRCGEHDRDRLRHVRQHRRDAVAGADAFRPHRLLQARDEARERVEAEPALDLVFAAKHDRRAFAASGAAGFRQNSAAHRERSASPASLRLRACRRRPSRRQRRRNPRPGPRTRRDPPPTRHAAHRSRQAARRCDARFGGEGGNRQRRRASSDPGSRAELSSIVVRAVRIPEALP